MVEKIFETKLKNQTKNSTIKAVIVDDDPVIIQIVKKLLILQKE